MFEIAAMKYLFHILIFLSCSVLGQSIGYNETQRLYQTNPDSAFQFFQSITGSDSSQSHVIGRSLLMLAIEDRNDSLVIAVGYELGQSLIEWQNIEEAKVIFYKLLSYSVKRNLSEGISYSYKGLGDAEQNDSNYEEAIKHFLKAEIGWKGLNNYQRLGYLYNNIGVAYRKQGNTYMALNYYIKAVDELEKAGDIMALAYINGNIGNIYLDQEQYEKALSRYMVGLEASIKAGNHRMIANLASSVGLGYDKLGETDKSFKYFMQAYREAIESGNQEILLLTMSNLGESYADLDMYDSAIYYINQALEKSILIDDVESQTIALLGLGTVHIKQGNYVFARQYLEEGLRLALETKQIARATAAYEDLSVAAEEIGLYNEALAYARQFKHLSDSLSDIKQSNNIKLLQAEFEFENEQEKATAQIKQLTAENEIQTLRLRERNLVVIISLVLLMAVLVISYLIYHQRLVRKKNEANDLKQKLLRVQLNPHFMFNSLNAIQNMVFKDVDKYRTADYLARFSHLTRQILELNQHDFISLKDEIDFIENYLSIQQIRFDTPFEYEIKVADEIDLYSTHIPPMITQPFLENAIEHGIMNKNDGGKVSLYIDTNPTHLLIDIIDNGVGREKAAFLKRSKQHRSMATQITKDRLESLQKYFKRQASMSIEDIFDADLISGTVVRFKLPLKIV